MSVGIWDGKQILARQKRGIDANSDMEYRMHVSHACYVQSFTYSNCKPVPTVITITKVSIQSNSRMIGFSSPGPEVPPCPLHSSISSYSLTCACNPGYSGSLLMDRHSSPMRWNGSCVGER